MPWQSTTASPGASYLTRFKPAECDHWKSTRAMKHRARQNSAMCEPLHTRPNSGALPIAPHPLGFPPGLRSAPETSGEDEVVARNVMPVGRMEPIMLTIKKVISPNLHDSPPKAARSQAVEASPLKVLIVDGHFLVREALCDLLKELESSAIFMEAADGHHAVQLAAEQDNIGLVLLGMNVPDRDDFTVLTRIRAHLPMASVVVLLDQPDRATVVKALN